MEIVFKKLKILSNHFVQFGCGIGTIEIELKQMGPQYIKNIGNWKSDTQDEFYWDNITIKIKKVMTASSENPKIYYNPRTLPKPTEEIQRLIFTFIE